MHVAVYGPVRILREKCPDCGFIVLVVKGRFACCGEPGPEPAGRLTQKRMSEREVNRRRTPTRETMRTLLDVQGDACFYCLRHFGETVYDRKRKRHIELRIEWDHKTPLAYSCDNSQENFVAACHVCNRMKSSYIFGTVEAARSFILERWKRRYPEEFPAEAEPST